MPLLVPCLLVLAAATTLDESPAYLDQTALLRRCNDLVQAHPDRCRRDTLGMSRTGEDIPLLVLGDPLPETASARTGRPALLIVAGLDGTHLVGTEAAVRVVQHLLDEQPDLLKAATVYVVPRGNPDATAKTLGGAPQVATLRPVDDDRDGVADEDGPEDIDGDGLVLLMRVLDPAPPEQPTQVADSTDPRVMRAPDANKGERARYRLLTEGIDNDNDGLFNEDGLGGVDLDMNFMHRWPEHQLGAGPFQLSEPESSALAEFVIAHPEIAAAIVYGPHDNLVNAPDSRGREPSGVPSEIDAGDAALYAEIGRIYKESAGQSRSSKKPTAGSFEAWMYAQRGVPTFASTVWGRPDATPKPGEAPTEGEAAKPAPPAGESPSGAEGGGEAPPTPPPGGGRGRRSRGRGGPPPTAPAPTVAGDPDAAAWLAWSDNDRDGAGFVEWKAFDHPQLGRVEIGGFVPGFTINPPPELLDELGAKQAAFATEILKRLPVLAIEAPVVDALGDGVYRIPLG
ncbi:MAG: hypothetical protein KDA22_12330, partial [Phycisphaerales bacterium]|nr:hypothetical protein [Phycisphaerales bacterium]